MAGLFVDTWGWLALRDSADRQHTQVASIFDAVMAQKQTVVTTDYVLDETFTLLFRRLASHKAKESMDTLTAAVAEESVLLVPIHPIQFREAIKLRAKYKDKPEISFTDFTSMAVMRELKLSRILTEDRHFTHVGMGFDLVP